MKFLSGLFIVSCSYNEREIALENRCQNFCKNQDTYVHKLDIDPYECECFEIGLRCKDSNKLNAKK